MNAEDLLRFADDTKKELVALQGEAVSSLVQQELENYKFGINNLDNSLTNFIMKNSGQGNSGTCVVHMGDMATIAVMCGEKPAIMHKDSDKIITDILTGNNVYFYGGAGTGKTYLAKQIAKRLGRQTAIITCSQWTSPISIIGGETIKGYRQGILVDAWKRGKIFIADELPKLDPNTAGLLNEALAQTGEPNDACILHYEGKLGIGTKVYRKVGENNDKKMFVDDVWGVGEGMNYTYYWIDKENEEEGIVVAIEDNFIPLTEGQKPSRVFKSGDKVIQFKTLTDGSGRKQPRHPYFGVIATGNTDMKNISNDYSGNNRQDYSLVDRFAGSYYYIEINEEAEIQLIYPKVKAVSDELRRLLAARQAMESISLRTMLNFNRIYEVQGLAEIGSKKFAIDGLPADKIKTFKDSVDSFVFDLNDQLKEDIKNDNTFQNLLIDVQFDDFEQDFINLHGVNPKTGEAV